MKVGDLQLAIEEIIRKNPEAKDSRILIDTEARQFMVHMVPVEAISYDVGANEAMGAGEGDSFTTLFPSYESACYRWHTSTRDEVLGFLLRHGHPNPIEALEVPLEAFGNMSATDFVKKLVEIKNACNEDEGWLAVMSTLRRVYE